MTKFIVMPAPEGNQYWIKRIENGSQNGRPALFKDPEVLRERFVDYIEYMETKKITKVDFVKSGPTAGQLVEIPCRVPYTLEGFCLFCGITSDRFNQMMKDEKYKDLFGMLTYIKETIRNDQIEGGLVGTLNPMLVARIQGLKEQQEISADVKNTTTHIEFIQRSVEDTTYTEVQDEIDNI